MRGLSWTVKASQIYTCFVRLLNWFVTRSGFTSSPAFKLPGSNALWKLSSSKRKAEGSAYRSEKVNFLATYGDEYGYSGSSTPIDELRASDFARLNGTVYVDHGGATLHADSQLEATLKDFSSNLYGNPHSQSDSSMHTSKVVESARQQVLDFCNAPAGEYKCIFTSGATAALKLVGETFPWSSDSEYVYSMENHNSVLGIREYALYQGVTVTAVDIESVKAKAPNKGADISINRRAAQKRSSVSAVPTQHPEDEVYNLFAFPLECNFSGAKFDIDLVSHIQQGKHVKSPRRGQWMVLLDAAKGCGSKPPDLSRYSADFVAISFYKIFGYPTGLGALLVRNDAAKLLRKRFFGGGTVAMSIADADRMQKRERVEQWLEDGTATFLGIAALRHGFASINRLPVANISLHTGALTSYTATKLATLKHGNGAPVCVLYGNHGLEKKYWGPDCNQGPIVTFNLKRADGSWVGHREVEKLAGLSNIQLRTGCFCNPGACAKYLGLSQQDLLSNFEAGHVCWDDQDLINGRPTGAVRVSYGNMSTFEDCWAVFKFIIKYFVEISNGARYDGAQLIKSSLEAKYSNSSDGSERNSTMLERRDQLLPASSVKVESMVVYPIKSCTGFSVDVWPLSNCGLLYDREWMLQTAVGDTLTQKTLPSMCSIQTSIDLSTEIMQVWAPNIKHRLAVPLQQGAQSSMTDNVMLCGNRVGGSSYGDEVSNWFTEVLGIPCTLVRREAKSRAQHSRRRVPASLTVDGRNELSFANEGQFLLVSKASVDELNRRITTAVMEDWQSRESSMTEHGPSIIQVDAFRFRPNIVVTGGSPNDEDHWQQINICGQNFAVLGGCNRCQMVNIDQATGFRHKQSQPLATLASYRRNKGSIMFGILLVQENIDAQNCDQQILPLEVETSYTKWLRTRYTRLLSVGCEVSVRIRV